MLLHTLVIIQVRLAHGVYPISRSTLKPLVSTAVMLAVEMGVDAQLAGWAGRVPLAIAAGLVSFLAVNTALGLAPEDKQLIARIAARVRSWLGRAR
jgi:hypothetical protein